MTPTDALMPASGTDDPRRRAELSHGRAIAGRAATVWGQHGLAGQERVRRRSVLLLDAALVGPGARVLELGCGTGEYTARLAERGATLVALDLVGDLVRVALARGIDGSVRFTLGDAERLPFPDGAFDAVVGNAVLHHLRIRPALRELRRVLKPGGRYAFTEPNMLNPQVAIQKNVPPIKRWLGDTPHETAFFAPQARRLLVQAGLLVDRITPFDFLHPVIPAAAVPPAQRLEAALERLPLLSHLAGSLLISGHRAR
jgi:SAM-dependent methyltransferase